MCDFHSVIVDGAGRIYHLPSNSHSGIAAHFNLDNSALESPFWECEWDGIGAQPIKLCQLRGKMIEPTALAVCAVDRHYENLAKILRGQLSADDVYPFNTAEYSDVPERIEWSKQEEIRRAEYEKAQAEKRAKRELAEKLGQTMFDVFGEKIETFSDEGMVFALRTFIAELSVSINEVAREEIDEEIESATEDMVSLDNGDYAYIGDGDYIYRDDLDDYVRDSSDYYTQDQLDDAIEEAKTEWKREVCEALENIG